MSSALHGLLLFSALWTLSLCGTRQFHVVKEGKNWTEAQKYCRENFTDLATIENQEEMDTVNATLNGTTGIFWIGLRQKSWIWSDGSNFSYSDWNQDSALILIKENKTWWKALRYCRENHVDLVSVHTEGIQQWVENSTKTASTANVWVGLRHICTQGFWFWVSGSTICYQNWAPGNGTGVEDCSGGERSGAVQSGSKQWVSLPETQTLNFICTASQEDMTEQSFQQQLLTVMSSALHGLLLFSALWTLSLCGTPQFHVVKEGKNWTEAQKYCRENFTDLVSIENQEEMDAVKAALNGTTGNYWIGLKQKVSWSWSDGSNFSYSDWNTSEPNNPVGDNCVQLYSEYGYKWADAGCHWPGPFVCYGLCTLSSCGSRQFHVVKEGKNWTEAQKFCRENFTDLATIESQEEMNASWIWSDKSNFSYSDWYTGEPNNPVGDICVQLNSTAGYKWIDAGCHWQDPFVCYEEIPLILIKEKKTWWEALRYCREKHVDLVSVHTEEIQHWVEFVTKNVSTANVWVGLRHTCAQGLWFWVSGSTICYQNWAPGNGTGVEDCSGGERSGAVQSGSKQWVSLPETQSLNFICTASHEC
ncbi:macrophage mannose receptor 1-like [Salminus brasiliensis]|uniref:macrophage mannose receptor 1-like n=1 Tax=Salminus brasiliensis TaxID=930266 RepID=UPI003B836152